MGKLEKGFLMILVADSSALIALATCDSLGALDFLFKEVKVPEAVYKEVMVKTKKHADTLMQYLKEKVIIVDLENITIIKDGTLELGELEAIALYKKLDADRLLIDDLRGRKIAEINNVKIIGSLGVLLLAKEKMLYKEIRQKVEVLRKSDIYFSDELLNFILKIANES